MEWLLEILFYLVHGIIRILPFKKEKSRIWAMTVLFLLLFGIVDGLFVVNAVGFYHQGSMAGTIVMGVLSVIVAIVAAVLLIRGHRRGWENW
ncbi:MAG: hypothetical protein IJX01_08355 [Oscillospiraceae bacterium]|nr:hypothetical protein [Oscillospiraceae bacterium]